MILIKKNFIGLFNIRFLRGKWRKLLLIIVFIGCFLFYFGKSLINWNSSMNKNSDRLLEENCNQMTNVMVKVSLLNSSLNVNDIQWKDFSGEYQKLPCVYPKNKSVRKYSLSEIYFALATGTKRIRNTIHFIKFWAEFRSINCLIVFEEKDFLSNPTIKEFLLQEGVLCDIYLSNVTRYEERSLQLFDISWKKTQINQMKIEWFAVGDDDTVWFIENLLKTLEEYNSSERIYLGDISDKISQVQRHGDYYGYGGGGILLSRPLTSLFSQKIFQCKKYLHLYGGDEMIGKCLTEIIQVNLTINRHFHQFDHIGDMIGILQSGIEGLISFHHMFYLWKPFPDSYQYDIRQTMILLKNAYQFYQHKFLQRYFQRNYKLNQTFLLTLGYSFSLFHRIISDEEFQLIEQTWPNSLMVGRKTRTIETNKKTFFFKSIDNLTSSKHSTIYQYQNNNHSHLLTIQIN